MRGVPIARAVPGAAGFDLGRRLGRRHQAARASPRVVAIHRDRGGRGKELRLLLTSPTEFEKAITANWAVLKVLRDSKKAGTAKVLYGDKTGKKLWKALG